MAERVAVFDQDAFYALRSLLKGPLKNTADLAVIERFLRAYVLHDDMYMVMEPWPYHPANEAEWTPEQIEAGVRPVIVAIGPTTDEYGLFGNPAAEPKPPSLELEPRLLKLAEQFSNADEGNVYYKAHVEYLQRLVHVSLEGGSLVCDGAFARSAVERAAKFPATLFDTLDADWQEYVGKATEGDIGLVVPPVLSIVLSRCAKREAIPAVLRDLREEWAEARAKAWSLLDSLKQARTIGEAKEIRGELEKASRLLSPAQEEAKSFPTQVLWRLVTGAGAGAMTGMLADGQKGAILGAITGTISQAANIAREADFHLLFSRGAFDLARRVREEAMQVEPDALSRILSEAERKGLGI